MDIAVIAIVAALASALTLYSGFGLGTILLPAFALFFPAPVAVAATGVVHLLNNLFKGTLLRKRADWPTVLKFGLPAVPAAVAGAWLLAIFGDTPRLFECAAFGRTLGPTGAGLTIGLLMVSFALLELQRWFHELKAPPRLMPLGGMLTGCLRRPYRPAGRVQVYLPAAVGTAARAVHCNGSDDSHPRRSVAAYDLRCIVLGSGP